MLPPARLSESRAPQQKLCSLRARPLGMGALFWHLPWGARWWRGRRKETEGVDRQGRLGQERGARQKLVPER